MSILDDLKLQYKMGDVAIKLIFINLLLFIIPGVVGALLLLFKIDIDVLGWVALSSNPKDLLFKPYTLFSYFFFHAGFFHILSNLIMLHFSSGLFRTFFTQNQLLRLYLQGGVFAGIIYIISYLIFPALVDTRVNLVGASGAVMAVLFAITSYAPKMEVRLLLIGTVKLWHIAAVFLLIDLIQLPVNNTGGHLAHLGGALFGYLFARGLQNGTDVTMPLASVVNLFSNIFSSRKSKPFRKVYKNTTLSKSISKKEILKKDKTQQQIDDILDKISASGYDSLTDEEREFLSNAGK